MSFIRVKDEAGIRTVTLDRPEQRNALLPEMQEALIKAFHGASAAGVRVVMLRGEGEAFCAGLDLGLLKAMATQTASGHKTDADRMARTLRAIWDCDVPTIAVVHRAAVAGGAGLALVCDFTIAGPEAFFAFTEVRIGFIPALVGVYLTLAIGDKAARSLLLSGRKIDANEAFRIGLITEATTHDQVDDRALELASNLKANSPESLRDTKRLLRAQQAAWLDHALSLALEANAASRETADFHEGVASFLEKRKPKWAVK